jgi:hypothetical protein
MMTPLQSSLRTVLPPQPLAKKLKLLLVLAMSSRRVTVQ